MPLILDDAGGVGGRHPRDELNDRRPELTRWLALYAEHCTCAAPQPKLGDSRAAEHADDCQYREAVRN